MIITALSRPVNRDCWMTKSEAIVASSVMVWNKKPVNFLEVLANKINPSNEFEENKPISISIKNRDESQNYEISDVNSVNKTQSDVRSVKVRSEFNVKVKHYKEDKNRSS